MFKKGHVFYLSQLDEQSLASNPESPQSQELEPVRKRRTRIPDKPNYSLNLWSIMKNCIGKELSKIPMPVCLSVSLQDCKTAQIDCICFQRILSFLRLTSTSPCLCCSVSLKIWSTTSCWTGAPSARALWSRCAMWQLSPFPLTPLQFTARANPSTLCWERHLSWTACRRAATGPSVNRWAFVYPEIEDCVWY